MYWFLGVDAGTETATADIFSKQVMWLRVSIIVQVFFYTALTAVKLSFLFFFEHGRKCTRVRLVLVAGDYVRFGDLDHDPRKHAVQL